MIDESNTNIKMSKGFDFADFNKKLQSLPPLSDSSLEILNSLNDKDIDIYTLSQKIIKDPSATAYVLKLANSPFYSAVGEITSAKDACVILGLHTIRNALTAYISYARIPTLNEPIYDRSQLIQHCGYVALLARNIAANVKEDEETAYTAGLLHDIGKLLIEFCYPEELNKVKGCNDSTQSLVDSEHTVLGITHADIGAYAGEKWNFPTDVVKAIGCHHSPNESEHRLTDIIYLSDTIVHQNYPGDELKKSNVNNTFESVLDRLNMSLVDAEQCFEEVKNQSDNVLL